MHRVQLDQLVIQDQKEEKEILWVYVVPFNTKCMGLFIPQGREGEPGPKGEKGIPGLQVYT